jgi:hypothetical protein
MELGDRQVSSIRMCSQLKVSKATNQNPKQSYNKHKIQNPSPNSSVMILIAIELGIITAKLIDAARLAITKEHRSLVHRPEQKVHSKT